MYRHLTDFTVYELLMVSEYEIRRKTNCRKHVSYLGKNLKVIYSYNLATGFRRKGKLSLSKAVVHVCSIWKVFCKCIKNERNEMIIGQMCAIQNYFLLLVSYKLFDMHHPLKLK